MGICKMLGAIGILAPGLPRLMEWGNAGMFFRLTGAAISHAATGVPAGDILAPVVTLCLVTASWVLRPARYAARTN